MKNIIVPIIIAMIAFVSVSCENSDSSSGNETKNDTTAVKNDSVAPKSKAKPTPVEDLSIDHGAAGPFAINAAFPGEGSYQGYELVRKVETRDSEDGSYEVVSYDCQVDGVTHIVLYPNTESDGSEGALIQEIKVVSESYKTNAGIGVGSSIEDFYASYEDAEALYTYISDAYWLETKALSSAQFRMKDTDYTEEPHFDSDLTELKKDKFKEGAKIEFIRIF